MAYRAELDAGRDMRRGSRVPKGSGRTRGASTGLGRILAFFTFPASLLTVLLMASPVAGQAVASGRVQLRVEPVGRLDVEPTAATAVSDGEYLELPSAARMRVSANTSWRLVVRTLDREPKTAWTGPGTGPTVSPTWVRVQAGGPALTMWTAEYVPVTAGAVVVAEGVAGGSQDLLLDYRWLEDSASGDAPPQLLYELVLEPGR